MANDMRRAGSSAPLLTFCPGTFSAACLSCGQTLLGLLAVLPAVLRSVFAAFQNPPLPHHGRKRAVFVFASLVFLSSGNALAQGGDSGEPCEGGGYNPTPTEVAVTAVPIVVESTTADYFVLYAARCGWKRWNYLSW